jgi:hypothetical protein
MTKTENFEQVEVTSQEQFRDWLEVNHCQPKSVWLVTYKKHTGDRYVSEFRFAPCNFFQLARNATTLAVCAIAI